jgi:hypothetical protein
VERAFYAKKQFPKDEEFGQTIAHGWLEPGKGLLAKRPLPEIMVTVPPMI